MSEQSSKTKTDILIFWCCVICNIQLHLLLLWLTNHSSCWSLKDKVQSLIFMFCNLLSLLYFLKSVHAGPRCNGIQRQLAVTIFFFLIWPCSSERKVIAKCWKAKQNEIIETQSAPGSACWTQFQWKGSVCCKRVVIISVHRSNMVYD